MKFYSVLAAFAAIVFSALTAIGHSRPAVPLDVYIGMDTSGSSQPTIAAYAKATCDVVASLEEQDHLDLYRFNCDCEEVYDNTPPEDLDKFKAMLVHTLSGKPARAGTNPEPLFNAIARRAKAHPGHQVVCLILSDGDDDLEGAQHEKALRMSIDGLTQAQPRLVQFMGIHSDQRAIVHQRFAALGDRVQLIGPDEMDIGSFVSQISTIRIKGGN